MKFGWTAWLMQLKWRGHLSVQELASGYTLGNHCQIHKAIDPPLPPPLSLYANCTLPLTVHVNRHQANVATGLQLQSAPHNLQVPKILISVGYITTLKESIYLPKSAGNYSTSEPFLDSLYILSRGLKYST